jgi:hypothetical protein
MDKIVEIALIFAPQVIFIFLIIGFYQQDMNAIFYISDTDNVKRYRFSNHLYLYAGIFLISIVLLPYSILGYINGTITDFYIVFRIILSWNGILFIVLFVVSRVFRNVSLDETLLVHRKFFNSVAFDIQRINAVRLQKGLFFPDVIFEGEGRIIIINSFCFNINKLLFNIAKTDKNVITKEFIDELYNYNKLYKREVEAYNKLVEVINND